MPGLLVPSRCRHCFRWLGQACPDAEPLPLTLPVCRPPNAVCSLPVRCLPAACPPSKRCLLACLPPAAPRCMVNCLPADRFPFAAQLTSQLTTHRTTQRNADKHRCFAYAHDTTHDTNHDTNHGTHFIIIIIKRSLFVRASACASARARMPNVGPM